MKERKNENNIKTKEIPKEIIKYEDYKLDLEDNSEYNYKYEEENKTKKPLLNESIILSNEEKIKIIETNNEKLEYEKPEIIISPKEEIILNQRGEEITIEKSIKIDFEQISNSIIFSQIKPEKEYLRKYNPIKENNLNMKSILLNQFLNTGSKFPIKIKDKFSIHLSNIEYFNINDKYIIIINQREMIIYKWKINKEESNNSIIKYFNKIINIWKPEIKPEIKQKKKDFLKLTIHKKIYSSYFLFLVRTKKISNSLITYLLFMYQSLLILKIRMIDKIFNELILYLNIERVNNIETFLIKEEIHFFVHYISNKILLNSNFEITEIKDSFNLFKKEEYYQLEKYIKRNDKQPLFNKFNNENLRSFVENKFEFYLNFKEFEIKKVFLDQNLIIDNNFIYRIILKNSLLIIYDNKINILKNKKLNFIKTFNLFKIERIAKFRNLLFFIFEDKITCLNLENYDKSEVTYDLNLSTDDIHSSSSSDIDNNNSGIN